MDPVEADLRDELARRVAVVPSLPHAPPQPVKNDPAAGVVVNVTLVPAS